MENYFDTIDEAPIPLQGHQNSNRREFVADDNNHWVQPVQYNRHNRVDTVEDDHYHDDYYDHDYDHEPIDLKACWKPEYGDHFGSHAATIGPHHCFDDKVGRHSMATACPVVPNSHSHHHDHQQYHQHRSHLPNRYTPTPTAMQEHMSIVSPDRPRDELSMYHQPPPPPPPPPSRYTVPKKSHGNKKKDMSCFSEETRSTSPYSTAAVGSTPRDSVAKNEEDFHDQYHKMLRRLADCTRKSAATRKQVLRVKKYLSKRKQLSKELQAPKAHQLQQSAFRVSSSSSTSSSLDSELIHRARTLPPPTTSPPPPPPRATTGTASSFGYDTRRPLQAPRRPPKRPQFRRGRFQSNGKETVQRMSCKQGYDDYQPLPLDSPYCLDV